MQGVLGLLLLFLGGILLYDVIAGKASSILGLINGQVETTGPSNSGTGTSTDSSQQNSSNTSQDSSSSTSSNQQVLTPTSRGNILNV